MEIGYKVTGLTGIQKSLELIGNDLSFAMAKALTKTAYAVKPKVVDKMKTVFDRPTPYSLNSLWVSPATKDRLESTIKLKDEKDKGGTEAHKYLGPEIFGGDRNLKRFEIALQYAGVLPKNMFIVPGAGAEIDRYGNMNNGQIIKILSYFKAFEMTLGRRANITDKRKAKMAKGIKNRRVSNLGISYFSLQNRKNGLPPGIYQKVSYANSKKIKPVMIFVKKPMYNGIFAFYDIIEEEVNKRWWDIFSKSLSETIRHGGL